MSTDALDFEGAVGCPHCCGILTGRWRSHSSVCPAAEDGYECAKCGEAPDRFMEWMRSVERSGTFEPGRWNPTVDREDSRRGHAS